MNRTVFRGRAQELALLDNLWQTEQAALLILYGRRRVGKTRLLTHWRETHAERALYWVAEPTSALHQLRSFSQAVYNFAHPDRKAPRDFTYADWEQAFDQVAEITKDGRMALFIDEVTYLIEVDPDYVGMLQKVWDHILKQSNLILALSGSQMGLMQKELLNYQAPLYGRATSQLKLQPLPYTMTDAFFPDYTPEDRVAIYSIFGGIPAYWERMDPDKPIGENIRRQLLSTANLMHEEPRILLQDFITDTSNYVGIMRAIASGAETQKDICNHTGLSQGHVSKNLSVLRDTGFVARIVPVTEASENSRRGRYNVTDPYLRFYYRFLSPHQSQLAVGAQDEWVESIRDSLPDFIESYTWKEICQEWLFLAAAKGLLPVPLEQVGGTWTRTQTVPVAGINRAQKTLILGDCYWDESPVGHQPIRDLVKRANSVIPKTGDWKVYFVSFSRSGWTDRAVSEISQMSQNVPGGKNWQATGMRLLELNQVLSDLAEWTLVEGK